MSCRKEEALEEGMNHTQTCEDTPQGDDESTVEPTCPDTSTSEDAKKKENQELAQPQTANSVGSTDHRGTDDRQSQYFCVHVHDS
jgi:hypothetical protein